MLNPAAPPCTVTGITLFSVCELRRDGELELLPGAGADEPALPTFNDAPLAKHELERLVGLHVRIEDLEGPNSIDLLHLIPTAFEAWQCNVLTCFCTLCTRMFKKYL